MYNSRIIFKLRDINTKKALGPCSGPVSGCGSVTEKWVTTWELEAKSEQFIITHSECSIYIYLGQNNKQNPLPSKSKLNPERKRKRTKYNHWSELPELNGRSPVLFVQNGINWINLKPGNKYLFIRTAQKTPTHQHILFSLEEEVEENRTLVTVRTLSVFWPTQIEWRPGPSPLAAAASTPVPVN